MEFKHEPVLLKECIEALNIKPDGIYVDGTLGGAGHSYEIVKKLSPKGLLIGIDRDSEALKAAKEIATPVIDGCNIYYECKIVYSADLIKDGLPQDILKRAYPAEDLHRLFFGRIVACYQ